VLHFFDDMPQANKFTVHIMAAVAEQEAEAISKRTKAALAAAKARGVTLGGRRVTQERLAEMAVDALRATSERADRRNEEVLLSLNQARAQGAKSLRELAAALNAREVEALRCGHWSAVQVRRVLICAERVDSGREAARAG